VTLKLGDIQDDRLTELQEPIAVNEDAA